MKDKGITIFDNINAEIRRRHITQEELCNKIGVPRRTYTGWQSRNDMPASALLSCTIAIGCTLNDLAKGVNGYLADKS